MANLGHVNAHISQRKRQFQSSGHRNNTHNQSKMEVLDARTSFRGLLKSDRSALFTRGTLKLMDDSDGTITPSTSLSSVDQEEEPQLKLDELFTIGREKECADIRKSLELVHIERKGQNGRGLLVYGEDGMGKGIALRAEIANVKKERMDTHYVSGKFEKNNIRPLGAIVDALNEICMSIRQSCFSNEIKKRVRASISDSEFGVLSSVVPIIKSLFPEIPLKVFNESTVVSDATLVSFIRGFRNFLTAVCDQFAPIVMVLYDLQFADDASKLLLASLFRETRIHYFLLLGTIIEGGKSSFEVPENSCMQVQKITFHPLSEESVIQSVAVATGLDMDLTKSLGQLVHRRTHGNPYFVRNYLGVLLTKRLLRYDRGSRRFVWSTEEIASKTNPEPNVVEVVIQKIKALSPSTQMLLMVAAKLGFKFHAHVLEPLMSSIDLMSTFPRSLFEDEKDQFSGFFMAGMTSKEIFQALSFGLNAGLIERHAADGSFRFTHDRVQQAVLYLFPKGSEGDRISLALSCHMYELSREKFGEAWMLFSAATLMTSVDGSIVDSRQVAELCVEASKKAASQAAYQTAAKYADKGLKRLGRSCWKRYYTLTLELCNLGAEMHYAGGNLDTCKKRVGVILDYGRTATDKARAYNVLIDTHRTEEQFQAAVDNGVKFLEELGVPCPKVATPFAVLSKFSWVRLSMRGRNAQTLESLPNMTDKVAEHEAALLGKTAEAAWCAGDLDRCILSCIQKFELTLKCGLSTVDGPHAFSLYALALAFRGHKEEACSYAQSAMALARQPKYIAGLLKTSNVLHCMVLHLSTPMAECLDCLVADYELGMKYNPYHAGLSLRQSGIMSVFVGRSLVTEETILSDKVDTLLEYKQHSSRQILLPFAQLVENLRGKTKSRSVLRGTFADGEKIDKQVGDQKVGSVDKRSEVLAYHHARVVLLYICGEHEQLEKDRAKYYDLESDSSTLYVKLFHALFCALNAYELAMKTRRRKYIRVARDYINVMDRFGVKDSPTVPPMLALLKGEHLRFRGKTVLAAQSYLNAISGLEEGKFYLVKGIAQERLARCYESGGMLDMQKESLRHAWGTYTEYGAAIKLDLLREEYGDISRQ